MKPKWKTFWDWVTFSTLKSEQWPNLPSLIFYFPFKVCTVKLLYSYIPPLSPKHAVALFFLAQSIALTMDVRPYSSLLVFHLCWQSSLDKTLSPCNLLSLCEAKKINKTSTLEGIQQLLNFTHFDPPPPLCFEMDFMWTFQASTKCNNRNSVRSHLYQDLVVLKHHRRLWANIFDKDIFWSIIIKYRISANSFRPWIFSSLE